MRLRSETTPPPQPTEEIKKCCPRLSRRATPIAGERFEDILIELLENVPIAILSTLHAFPLERSLFHLQRRDALLVVTHCAEADQGEVLMIGASTHLCIHLTGGEPVIWKSNKYLFQNIDVRGIKLSRSYSEGQGSTTIHPLTILPDIALAPVQ